MKNKFGVLLINLGTPEAPTVRGVRKFLREFLSDRRVIAVPYLVRLLILHLFILPFRPRKTAKLYQSIWTEKGSPILYHSTLFAEQLAQLLGDSYEVVLAMRYGKPSLKHGVQALKACDKILVLPLFPQYSDAATGSAIAAAKKYLAKFNLEEKAIICADFFRDPLYLQALTHSIVRAKQAFNGDFILFSYHGLPERQLQSVCDKKNCDRLRGCLEQKPNLKSCYRAQCFATTDFIAQALGLSQQEYLTAFQSRLGRVQWIRPYSDHVLMNLVQQGVKRLMVVCPSFVADCLETLEEINLRLRDQWQALGGEAFCLVPCLNSEPMWVSAVAKLVKSHSNPSGNLMGCC